MKSLTARQRDALWLSGQGLTADAIGRHLDPPISGAGAYDLLRVVMESIEAKSTTNAVFKGLTLGIIGPYRDCGSRKAYLRHLRREEQSCIACRKANTAYVRAQRDAELAEFPDAGGARRDGRRALTSRQIEALEAIQNGATSAAEVGRALGIAQATARKMINRIMKAFGIDRHTYARPVSYPKMIQIGMERGYLNELPAVEKPLLNANQIKVLKAADGDRSLRDIARLTGFGPTAVASRLSEVYAIFGIVKRASRPGERYASRIRRAGAIQAARDAGIDI